ncbi:MAG: Hsp20/alpha crystallin family protein, partial [Bacteroidota bacterium]
LRVESGFNHEKGNMRYDKDRKWIRSVLKTSDIMNTLNGGTSQPRFNVKRNQDHLLITLVVPGVNADDLKVEIIDKNVVFHHAINFNDLDQSDLAIPHVLATYTLTAELDYHNVTAAKKGNRLLVRLPYNELSDGYHRVVDVMQ